MLAQKPAAGQTGKNLFDIMKKVYKSKDFDHNGFEVNEDGDQYQFSIINAYNHVYFRLVNGPEPKEEVILEKKNIDRIKKSISKITNKKYLIVCGNNAETLVNNNPCVFNWSHIAKVAHIGNVGIRNTYPNSYKYDGDKKIGNLPQEQRDQKRYEIIANNIIEQFKKYNK